ncbi:hypothetical protein K1719_027954 [Acacia pycnantha]|nr:hypothetical protein K1719_027954 [Acacia pycnantha]
MYLQRERCRAYANFYRATKEAEAKEAKNRLKLALKFMEAFVEIAKGSSGMTSFSPGYFNACSPQLDLFFTLYPKQVANIQNMI